MNTPLLEGLDKQGLQSYLTDRQYKQLFWQTFFPIKNVNSLDGKMIKGAVGSRVAAHVIAYNAKAPKASRKTITPVHFDIPKTAQSRERDEKDILEWYQTRAMQGNNAVLEDYWNDVDFVVDSCNARLEWFALQAISKTKIQLSTTNNPMGIVNETVVDFAMPTANKKKVAVVWSTGNAATMTPITDFKNVLKAARDAGKPVERLLMTTTAFDLMTASTQWINYAKGLIKYAENGLGLESLGVANAVQRNFGLPEITLIDTAVQIEAKDGTFTSVNPFDDNHVVFIPKLKLGDMYNGPIAEELEKPLDVLQAKKDNILVSTKKEFNPVSVLTKGECNAFPSFPEIDNCYSLYIASASAWA